MSAAMIGITVQLVGTAVAGGALVWELARPSIGAPAAINPSRNPWAGEADPRAPRPTGRGALENERWRNLGGFGVRPDPDVVAVSNHIADQQANNRERLWSAWDQQTQTFRQLHEANTELFDALRTMHRTTRRRVLVEMLGLLLVAVGTVVSASG